MAKIRRPRIVERYLVGRAECMFRPCEAEAVCMVAIPWETYGSPPEYQGTEGETVFPMCEVHAQRARRGGDTPG
jgi:hypothetical protein